MAFPTIAATGSGHTQVLNTTLKSISVPGASAGDRLLLLMAWDGNPAINSIDPVNGQSWTLVFGAANGSNNSLRIYEIISLSAGISPQVIEVALGASEMGGAQVLAISGSHPTEATAAATSVTGSSTTPNPGSLNPAGWATEDTMWLAVEGNDGNVSVSAYPTTFPDNRTNVRAAATAGAGVGYAKLASASASQDPGTFTIDATDTWVATTLAVRPAPAGGPATVDMAPAILTLAAVALDPVSQPVQVDMAPAVLTLAAVALDPQPVPVQVDMAPAVLILEAVALDPQEVGGVATVDMEPAILSFTAVPLDPASIPVQVDMEPAVLAFVAVALDPVVLPVQVDMAPAILTLVAVPLDPQGTNETVDMEPAVLVLVAVALEPVSIPMPPFDPFVPAAGTFLDPFDPVGGTHHDPFDPVGGVSLHPFDSVASGSHLDPFDPVGGASIDPFGG